MLRTLTIPSLCSGTWSPGLVKERARLSRTERSVMLRSDHASAGTGFHGFFHEQGADPSEVSVFSTMERNFMQGGPVNLASYYEDQTRRVERMKIDNPRYSFTSLEGYLEALVILCVWKSCKWRVLCGQSFLHCAKSCTFTFRTSLAEGCHHSALAS